MKKNLTSVKFYGILNKKGGEIMKKVIVTNKAPLAVGAYSQAVLYDSLLFTSGQLPINPETGEIVVKDIKAATKQCMDNIGALLEAANSKFSNIIKTAIYLKDINDFVSVNEVYESYFTDYFPARSCFEVSALPKNADIEIEVIAMR